MRDIEFRIPVQVSILSERRVYHPYGLEGGEDAACGLNIWVRRVRDDKRSDVASDAVANKEKYTYINMGGKNTARMRVGERIIVMTPGGGGFGAFGEESKAVKRQDPKYAWRQGSVAQRQAEAEASS